MLLLLHDADADARRVIRLLGELPLEELPLLALLHELLVEDLLLLDVDRLHLRLHLLLSTEGPVVDADDALAHLVLGPLLGRLLLLLRREVGAVRASLLPLAVLE